MRKILFALALLCTFQVQAFCDQNSTEGWRIDLARVIDAEHAILEQIPVHPSRKIVLCMVFPSQHYVAYKARLNWNGERILSYMHLKYDVAKKFFPWLKMHKKAYLEPLKGFKFKLPKEKAPEKPEVTNDSSPCDDHIDDQPEPDIAE